MSSAGFQGIQGLVHPGAYIHTMICQHLVHKKLQFFPCIPRDRIDQALTHAGIGLDHTMGEQVLGFGDMTFGGDWFDHIVITDRRVCGCSNEKPYNIRFSELMEMREDKGVIMSKLHVRSGNAWHMVSLADIHDQLKIFFGTLLQLGVELREPGPACLCSPSENDPTGASHALNTLPIPEPRIEALLRCVLEANRKGVMPDTVGKDFTSRIVLMHRNMTMGPGMTRGWWLSPLSADDLFNLVSWIFGRPTYVWEQPHRAFQFELKPKSDMPRALASSAVGVAVAMTFGLGWISIPKTKIKTFRLSPVDTGSFCSFIMDVPGLQKSQVFDFAQILGRLLPMFLPGEFDLLMRRVAAGWNIPAHELARIPYEELHRRLREHAGAVDISLLALPLPPR